MPPRITKFTWLIAVAVLSVLSIHAQHTEYKKLDTKDLLTSVSTYRTYEDSKGNIWFLTNKGISIFDGTRSMAFGREHGYLDGGAYQIQEDAQKNLWITTVNFKLYRYAGGRFSRVKSTKKICWLDINPGTGSLKVLTREYEGACIYSVNPDLTLSHLNTLHSFYPFEFIQHGKDFLVSSHNQLWLYKADKKTPLLPSNTFDNQMVTRVFRMNNRVIISNYNGIYEYDNGVVKLLYPLQRAEIFDIKFNAQANNIWVTSSKGILFFTADFKTCTGIHNIENTTVLTVNFTRKSGVLVSTVLGVFMCTPQASHFSMGKELEFSNTAFVRHESDNLYFFYENHFFYQYTHKKLIKRIYPESDASTKVIVLVKTLPDSSFAIFSRKVYQVKNGVLHLDSSELLRKNLPLSTPAREHIYLNYGNVLGQDSRMLRTEHQYLELITMLEKDSIDAENSIPIEAYGDTTFLGSNKGLIKVYFKGNRPIYKLIKVTGLIKQVIVNDTLLAISTETDGVYVYQGNSVKHINVNNKLHSNVCSVIRLRGPYLWIVTNKGLARVNLNNYSSVNFTERDYLLSDKVNDIDFFEGNVYVATDKGISFFREDSEINPGTPDIYLESASLNNQALSISNAYESGYMDNNYSFLLSSPGYRSAVYNRYRMIIESTTLNDTLLYKDANIQLLALAPDHYKLRFDVLNIDGQWSSKPVFVNLLIHPPFWKKTWFIGLVFFIVCAIAGYIVWLSVKRQKEMQEYKRKITESELKSLRLYMNPHFLFNSLTSLQSFILTVKTDEANYFITKFSKLIRAVMNYSVKGELLLKEEIELLRSYLELESVRFGSGFTYNVNCSGEINIHEITIPSLLIQPFVENAIKHGVTGAETKCYIKVWFEMRESGLYCIVTDNGKGRRNSAKTQATHISSGIRFTEERIKLLINEKEEVIKITDNDPMNTDMPGTRVEIHVPVLNNLNDD